MFKRIHEWLFGPSCVVYIACPMTGRDRAEQVERATFLCNILKARGIVPISPVIEEGIPKRHGPLVNKDKRDLHKKWDMDKHIIRRVAHVSLFDGADEGSVGMGREYGLNRWCLWKPTVILWRCSRGLTVAEWEDDKIVYTPQAAASVIANNWLSRWDRWVWRFQLLKRTLPKWIMDQIYAVR